MKIILLFFVWSLRIDIVLYSCREFQSAAGKTMPAVVKSSEMIVWFGIGNVAWQVLRIIKLVMKGGSVLHNDPACSPHPQHFRHFRHAPRMCFLKYGISHRLYLYLICSQSELEPQLKDLLLQEFGILKKKKRLLNEYFIWLIHVWNGFLSPVLEISVFHPHDIILAYLSLFLQCFWRQLSSKLWGIKSICVLCMKCFLLQFILV